MDSWPPQPVEQHRNWLDLPHDVTSSILQRLNPIEILTNTQKVCLHWRNICKDPSMWRTLNMMGNFVCLLKYKHQCDLVRNICRRAIDLSCGQLVAIEIGHFCDENLLKYITERSSGLRHLGLSCCEIPVEGFSEAVANIPLLDELELSYC